MTFKAHSELQERALFSEAKILALLTGIQYGKTTVGANRMKMAMHRHIRPDDNFLIISPTYKIMQQSTLPAFLNIMRNGEYNKVDAMFKMAGGGICYMRTATDPDSMVGLTNVRHIWVDEAGKISLYAWQNIQARAAFRNCQIDLTSSPYTLNWIYKEIVRPILKDATSRPDVELIRASSVDNPHFPKEEWIRNKATMDPRRFAMIFGGEWNKLEGLVYDCFDEDENQCDPIPLPQGTKYYGGIDWGYTEPFVLKVRAVLPNGYHYGISEVYKTGLTLPQLVDIAKQKKQTFGIERFYCDPSRPDCIEEFNRNGLPAIGANNSIRLGIDRHYELLKTRRLRYFRGLNPNTIDELETYHYPEPKEVKPHQDIKEQDPVGQNDHALDAEKYLSVELFNRGGMTHIPRASEGEKSKESQYDRINRLKRDRDYGCQTEKWS